jgi:hypothetical protein
MISELKLEEIALVDGAGEIGDAIRAAGEVATKIGNAAYDAGYRLGKAAGDWYYGRN